MKICRKSKSNNAFYLHEGMGIHSLKYTYVLDLEYNISIATLDTGIVMTYFN